MTITNNKIIICSGDSYVAGDELAADLLIPGYTSHLYPLAGVPKDAQALRDQIKEAEKKLSTNDHNEYWEKSKAKAWPTYLGKLSRLSVSNVGRRGISNQEIAHRAVESFHIKLSKGIDPSNITVLMMLTSPNRFGAPQHDVDYGGDFEYQSFMPGYDFMPRSIKHYCERIVKDFDDYDLLWFSYSNLIAAKHHIESLGGTVHFLDSCLWGWYIKNYKHATKKTRHHELSSSLKILYEMGSMAFDVPGAANLPGGHYNEVVHEYFAKELYVRLFT